MPGLRRTAQAEEDLIELWLYIAQDNPGAADRLLDEIEDKCLRLDEVFLQLKALLEPFGLTRYYTAHWGATPGIWTPTCIAQANATPSQSSARI